MFVNRYTPLVVSALLMIVAAWVGHDYYTGFEDYVRFMVRETAYVSTTFFLLAYWARPLLVVTGNAVARGLVRVRRQIGLAAALAHTVHFGAVVSLFRFTGESVDPVTFIFGGLGFVMFWVMALTSNDASVRVLGATWKHIHRFGIHYIWIIFMQTYLGDVARSPVYWVFVALLGGGLVLRIALYARSRRVMAAP
ncbi:MAG: hypothetical protein HC809_00345 [Gammaproteobacteria bacterium]|nr:hypothetical protein [Gammaproteobacteria bacterium]